MTEATNTTIHRRNIRRGLLASTSALALLVCAGVREADAANDGATQPPLWLELGGSLERINTGHPLFVPPFAATMPDFVTASPDSVQRLPPNSFGVEGALSYQPEKSDWVISASIRFGRTQNHNTTQQQPTFANRNQRGYNFFHAEDRNTSRHDIVDFKVGKDIGLGRTESNLSLGLRFAQFSAQTDFSLSENTHGYYFPRCCRIFDINKGEIHSERNFRGLGPSISWNGSAPLVGDPDQGELSLDWDAAGAVLFGRQKANVLHRTQAVPYGPGGYPSGLPQYDIHATRIRARSVVVPNVGGLLGISYRLVDFKVKLGYRADYFFGAMDGGIDTRKKENRGFFGPFASVSFGVGD